jgi:hypothetical protein
MQKNLLWLLSLASLSIVKCTQLNSSPPNLPTETNNMVEIQQTTVATIDGIRVVVGNIFLKDKYRLPDGSTQVGHTAMVGILGNWHTVGKGSIITIGESQWTVEEVQPGTDELGIVKLKKVE